MNTICLTSGKQQFATAKAAKASLLSKHNRRKHGGPKYTYRCPACGAVHLTRVAPEQIRRSRRSA
jgi:hypothetical protein